MTGLTFDPVAHVYTWQPAPEAPAVRLLSVTEILRRAGLVDTTGFTDEVRERGTRVHQAIAFDHTGLLDEETAADVMPWVLTWRRFVAESRFVPASWEQTVADPIRGYAGTYDVIGAFAVLPHRSVLIDLKTGVPQPSVGAQLAAYARCVDGRPARYALYLTPERYTLTEYKDRADEPLFLAALAVATWQVAHGL